jgi:hypothetical protein
MPVRGFTVTGTRSASCGFKRKSGNRKIEKKGEAKKKSELGCVNI